MELTDFEELDRLKMIVNQTFKGGEGSGNFGHAGRPGEVGGSASENDKNTSTRGGESKFTMNDKNKLNASGFEQNPKDKSEYRREVISRNKPLYSGGSRKWETIAIVDNKYYATPSSGFVRTYNTVQDAIEYINQSRK